MTFLPRPCQGLQDLAAMRLLLMEGRQSQNGAYYVHVGDLDWWLFYGSVGKDFPKNTFLWEKKGLIAAWALISIEQGAVDFYFHPSLERNFNAPHYDNVFPMLEWTVQTAEALSKELSHKQRKIGFFWISAQDIYFKKCLQQLGFHPTESAMIYHERSLLEGLPAPKLPDGFQVRRVTHLADAPQRAAASYAAFKSTRPFAAYLENYRQFIQSDGFTRAFDLMTLSPTGHAASFCIGWLDPLNKIGLFEPVGTHPDFQRLGLGRAVLLSGMELMRQHGMERAMVCAFSDELAAMRLYESVGFIPLDQLCTYEKSLS